MRATIKGVYTHAKDGEEYVTRNGNFYCKVLLALENEGGSLYESFFFTPKAHWRFEDLFGAAGKAAPSADQISANDLNDLIGDEIKINVGKNKQGYDTVTKFYPAATQTVAVNEQVPDEIAEQSADADLDEDVPF